MIHKYDPLIYPRKIWITYDATAKELNKMFPDKLQGQWRARLSAAKEMPSDERIRLAEEYVTALATEIVSQTTDEELKNIEP